MFARLLMFAFIVSFVSCASHERKEPKPTADRITVIEHKGVDRRI